MGITLFLFFVFISVYLCSRRGGWLILKVSISTSHNFSSFVSGAASSPMNVRAAAPVR
jgi:hypothetical protein